MRSLKVLYLLSFGCFVPLLIADSIGDFENENLIFNQISQVFDRFEPVSETIYFEYDQNGLTHSAVEELEQLVELITDNPDLEVMMEGHADAAGSEKYNLELSIKRAKSVFEYFKSKGIGENRMYYVGLGELHPAAINTYPNGNDSQAGRTYNRRVEVKVYKKNQANLFASNTSDKVPNFLQL